MLNPEIAVNRRPIDRLSRNAQLAALAERVQPIVTGLLAKAGTPLRNILHGTVLGHPLHPAVTDVPIGAWTVTAVLDALELAGGPAVPGADPALVIGLAGGVGAIVSGWADWSDTHEDPRTLGMAHALFNAVAFTAYAASLGLRLSGRRRAGLATALVGYFFVGTGAYLGGELALGHQLGGKHTAEPLTPPDDFVSVLDAIALTPATPVRVDFGGIPVLLSRSADEIFAISAVCTHRGAPLDQGTFAEGCVTCPWHASVFRLNDGGVVTGPATFPQPRFEARLRGEQIELRALQL